MLEANKTGSEELEQIHSQRQLKLTPEKIEEMMIDAMLSALHKIQQKYTLAFDIKTQNPDYMPF